MWRMCAELTSSAEVKQQASRTSAGRLTHLDSFLSKYRSALPHQNAQRDSCTDEEQL
jgi:hypothetical protein